MTPERMRIVAAQILGYTLVQNDDGEWELRDPSGKKIWADWDPQTTWDSCAYMLPDWANDLNACHEMEKGLNQFQSVHYPEILFEVVTEKKWDGNMGYFMPQFTRATALQRLEAFIRTHNKWEEA